MTLTSGVRRRFPPLQRAQIVELACLEPMGEGLHIRLKVGDEETLVSAVDTSERASNGVVSGGIRRPRWDSLRARTPAADSSDSHAGSRAPGVRKRLLEVAALPARRDTNSNRPGDRSPP